MGTRDFGEKKLKKIIDCINEYFEDEEEIGFWANLWDNISKIFSKRSTKDYVVSVSRSKKKTEDSIKKIWKGVFTVEDDFKVRFQNTDNIAQQYISAIKSISECINVKTLSSNINFNKISDSLDKLVEMNKIIQTAKKTRTEDIGDSVGEFVLGAIKKAGYFGSVVSAGIGIKDILTGGGPGKLVKTIYSGAKNILDFNKTLKNMGKAKRILHPDTIKQSWKGKIFGTKSYFASTGGKTISKASSWKTRFFNNFQKAEMKEVAKVGWISVAISGVVNAFDNRKEYEQGKISAGRAVAETVSETAVDVATDIALTATAAAAIGATFGAAPVVAVGAAVVGAKIGLDAIAKWATNGEKDFTEAASDLILDTGKAIGKGISEGASKLGKCISSSLKSLKPKWCFGF